MPTKPPAVHARTWLAIAALSLVLSAVAVAVMSLPSRGPLHVRVSHIAEAFASPGEMLWWATLGGPFRGNPTGVVGHFIWVVGTAVFWFLAAAILIAIFKRLRRARNPDV